MTEGTAMAPWNGPNKACVYRLNLSPYLRLGCYSVVVGQYDEWELSRPKLTELHNSQSHIHINISTVFKRLRVTARACTIVRSRPCKLIEYIIQTLP